MPTPEFVQYLRARIGTHPLWLSGATAVVFRDGEAGEEILLVRRADNGAWSPVCGIVDPGRSRTRPRFARCGRRRASSPRSTGSSG